MNPEVERRESRVEGRFFAGRDCLSDRVRALDVWHTRREMRRESYCLFDRSRRSENGHWLCEPSVFRSQVNRIRVINPKKTMTKIMGKYG